MQLFRAGLLAACALLAVNGNAMADATTDDVHCYMVYMQMLNAQDPKFQTAGIAGGLYFVGKLDGRDPHFDIESAVLAELPKLANKDAFLAEAQCCGKELQVRGASMSAMGKDMQDKAAKMQQNQNPH